MAMFYASIQANLDSKPLLIEKCTLINFGLLSGLLSILVGYFADWRIWGGISFLKEEDYLIDRFKLNQFFYVCHICRRRQRPCCGGESSLKMVIQIRQSTDDTFDRYCFCVWRHSVHGNTKQNYVIFVFFICKNVIIQVN